MKAERWFRVDERLRIAEGIAHQETEEYIKFSNMEPKLNNLEPELSTQQI